MHLPLVDRRVRKHPAKSVSTNVRRAESSDWQSTVHTSRVDEQERAPVSEASDTNVEWVR